MDQTQHNGINLAAEQQAEELWDEIFKGAES